MPRNVAVIIAKKIKELVESSKRMRNVKKLTDHPGYHMIVGGWRVVYTVKEKELLIHIVKIKSQGEIYK